MDFEYISVPPETHGQTLLTCPLCGHAAAMWEVRTSKGVFKAAMCDRGFDLDPLQDFGGCPLSLVGPSFNRSTYASAASHWNGFAMATTAQRELNEASPA